MKILNKTEEILLLRIAESETWNQRKLSEATGFSLGKVNQTLKVLRDNDLVDPDLSLTKKGQRVLKKNQPKKAVILAAGFGMRMVPINHEVPKGLLKVKNEVLIERLIRQLHSVEIYDIKVIVGFMKEKYEYLIDKFQVKLIVNSKYGSKNNLHSLTLVKNELEKSYIIPCDLWFEENPFSRFEFSSWYLVSNKRTFQSDVTLKHNFDLKIIKEKQTGNKMVGLAYINQTNGKDLAARLSLLDQYSYNDQAFWEKALVTDGKYFIQGKLLDYHKFTEINTYEQLRDFDDHSDHLNNQAIKIIEKQFRITSKEIHKIKILKKGMTNRSFLFSCKNKRYIMRIPGEGTDKLINRENEAAVYQLINAYKLADPVIYINPKNGYKITEFLNNTTNCDPNNLKDVTKCMRRLHQIHNLNLKVDHFFDLFKKINFYESLWSNPISAYQDYPKTKRHVFKLRKFIDSCNIKFSLTHIDAVPDNFLFTTTDGGTEEIKLIDWEYSSMQDPHVDIAMFAIYSMYNRQQIDQLINIYFDYQCSINDRIKIYCYIAICGLLWSNWCEYKLQLEVDFGEYSLAQYRYAKDYYRIAKSEMERINYDL